jgi:hypothetical protein
VKALDKGLWIKGNSDGLKRVVLALAIRIKMSGLSRSEQRQLEAAMNASMGVDGKKKKAEEAADAPSPAPARKKPAGKVPRSILTTPFRLQSCVTSPCSAMVLPT